MILDNKKKLHFFHAVPCTEIGWVLWVEHACGYDRAMTVIRWINANKQLFFLRKKPSLHPACQIFSRALKMKPLPPHPYNKPQFHVAFFLHRRHTIVSMNMEVNNSVTSWFINVFNWGSAQSAHFSKWKQKTHRNMRKKRKQTAQRKLRTETTAKWATRSPFEANENAYTLIYKNGSYREIISEQQKNGAAAVFEELAHTHTHG